MHALGSISNVTVLSATPGPSIELITFAALSWGIVVSGVLMCPLLYYCFILALVKGVCKYTIRVRNTEIHTQVG